MLCDAIVHNVTIIAFVLAAGSHSRHGRVVTTTSATSLAS
jgi:hypothetical protein